ncbi:hypothetical protein HanPI659440_Chr01g0018151 [Helianthus annuus]|nr:hypothetical protein HanPI659440_Chr01g0018151 [Helianthus annuus]
MQYFSSKLLVAFTISLNVNLPSRSQTSDSEFLTVVLLVDSSSLLFDLLRVTIQKIATAAAIKTALRTGRRTAMSSLSSPGFLGVLLMLHGDNPFSDPHRYGFPVKDAAGACLNTPASGTGPERLLYERSIACKLIMDVAID